MVYWQFTYCSLLAVYLLWFIDSLLIVVYWQFSYFGLLAVHLLWFIGSSLIVVYWLFYCGLLAVYLL